MKTRQSNGYSPSAREPIRGGLVAAWRQQRGHLLLKWTRWSGLASSGPMLPIH